MNGTDGTDGVVMKGSVPLKALALDGFGIEPESGTGETS